LFEAAIAAEHLNAPSFENTNWKKILFWYDRLYESYQSPFALLNKSIVLIQIGKLNEAKQILDSIESSVFESREYIFFCVLAEYHINRKEEILAASFYDKAIGMVNNDTERAYLSRKKKSILKVYS
jgi:RNA polymerase sigma-70 factor (ECF subfamily)